VSTPALAIWFNPLVWIAASALREERERAADDRVLGAGVRASDYASLLLDVASAAPAPIPCAASFAGERSTHLERRLRSILDPRLPRRPAGRVAATGLALLAVCAVAPLAASRREVAPTPGRAFAASIPQDTYARTEEVADEGVSSTPSGASAQSRRSRSSATTPSPTPTPTPTPHEYHYETEETPAPTASNSTVVAALEEALKDPDEGVRKQAKWALQMIRLREGHQPEPRVRVKVNPRSTATPDPTPSADPVDEEDPQ